MNYNPIQYIGDVHKFYKMKFDKYKTLHKDVEHQYFIKQYR